MQFQTFDKPRAIASQTSRRVACQPTRLRIVCTTRDLDVRGWLRAWLRLRRDGCRWGGSWFAFCLFDDKLYFETRYKTTDRFCVNFCMFFWTKIREDGVIVWYEPWSREIKVIDWKIREHDFPLRVLSWMRNQRPSEQITTNICSRFWHFFCQNPDAIIFVEGIAYRAMTI